MVNTFQLEIVTPERELVKAQVEEVQIPGKRGYLGILPGHAPLITELAVGEIVYRTGTTLHRLSCAWGFAEVLPERVTILAQAAELAETIDVPRAERALSYGEELLRNADSPDEVERALSHLKRAETRLEVAKKS